MSLLPNFFIIGAPKCGTTSLYFYLDEHHQIEMASDKEPEVLSDPVRVEGRDSWEGLFAGEAERRGEASTGYARYPVEGDVAARMHELVPEAKLIYLVREPVERVVSEYVQQLASGQEHLSIAEALSDPEDPANFYVCASRYGSQIENYLRYFDSRQLLVLEQWALKYRRRETLRAVFRFLEVDEDFWSPNYNLEFLNREDLRADGWLLPRLRRSPLRSVWRLLPVRYRVPLTRRVFGRSVVARPELDPKLRSALEAHLRPEVERLRELTGQPFEHLVAAAHGASSVATATTFG